MGEPSSAKQDECVVLKKGREMKEHRAEELGGSRFNPKDDYSVNFA